MEKETQNKYFHDEMIKTRNWHLISYIDNPDVDTIVRALQLSSGRALFLLKNITDDDIRMAMVNDNDGSLLRCINHISDALLTELLTERPELIQYARSPSEDHCLLAYKSSYSLIKYIDRPSVIKLELERNPEYIRTLLNPSEDLCEHLVNLDPLYLRLIRPRFQTQKVCWLALKANKFTFEYIDAPTEEMFEYVAPLWPHGCVTHKKPAPERACCIVIDWAIDELYSIRNPTENLILYALEKGAQYSFSRSYFSSFQTEKVCLKAIEENPCNLEYVKNHTEELILAAVKKNGDTIAHAHFQTPAIQDAAVANNASAFKVINDVSYETMLRLASINGMILEYIPNFYKRRHSINDPVTPELVTTCVKQNWRALQFAGELTEELCLIASEQNIGGTILTMQTKGMKRAYDWNGAPSDDNFDQDTIDEYARLDFQREMEVKLHQQLSSQTPAISSQSRRRIDVF